MVCNYLFNKCVFFLWRPTEGKLRNLKNKIHQLLEHNELPLSSYNDFVTQVQRNINHLGNTYTPQRIEYWLLL